MTTYNIPKHDGFKHLNPKLSDYEKAVTGIFNEMKLRQQDKDVENMQHSVVQFSKLKNLGQTNAKWDHKPVLKKHISSYFHKTLTDEKIRKNHSTTFKETMHQYCAIALQEKTERTR